jgi:hypothetical protein
MPACSSSRAVSSTLILLVSAVLFVLGAAPAMALYVHEEAKLLPSDGGEFHTFGLSVALEGHTAVIGAYRDDANGFWAGSAYAFTRTGEDWIEQAKFLPPEVEDLDYFGLSVAFAGDTALIGSSNDDDNDEDAGAVYVYTRTGGVWAQSDKLLASDGMPGDRFGYSVAIDGDTALVGAIHVDHDSINEGSAYVFARVAGTWAQQAELVAPDGALDDNFGFAVALEGDTAVIGAWHTDDLGTDSGSAYVFQRTGTVWTFQAKLLPPDGAARDEFGFKVALDGDTALIGAPQHDGQGPDSGSAYVVERTGSTWSFQAKLLASDGALGDRFGYGVALDGFTAIVGAVQDDDNGVESGSAYVYTREGDVWTERAKVLTSDGVPADYFGSSVALDGDTAVIGAYGVSDNGSQAGAAYVFRVYDDDVPATRTGGLVVLLATVLGAGVYLMRRRAAT